MQVCRVFDAADEGLHKLFVVVVEKSLGEVTYLLIRGRSEDLVKEAESYMMSSPSRRTSLARRGFC